MNNIVIVGYLMDLKKKKKKSIYIFFILFSNDLLFKYGIDLPYYWKIIFWMQYTCWIELNLHTFIVIALITGIQPIS